MVSEMEKLGIAAIGIMILVIIFGVIPMVGEKMDGVADIPTDTVATGTYTQSGVSVHNQTIVIGSETYTVTNTTTAAFDVPVGVNMTETKLIEELVTEITASSTLVTAVDNADNSTGITSVLADAAGNYATTENMTNGAFAATAMTGGVSGSNWDHAENDDIVRGSDLWSDTGGMIVLAAIISIVGVVIAGVMRFRKTTEQINETNEGG